MADVSAKDVMALRAATGMGMMDCKRALTETAGDIAAAEEWLRKKAKGKMDKRADRPAGEGRVVVAVSDDGRNAVIFEVRTETDFTAKNEKFDTMCEAIARHALTLPAGEISADDAITKAVDDVRLTTGENVQFARGHKTEGGSNTAYGVYVHHDGKTGVLVQGEGDVPERLLRDIAMHIAAVQPRPLAVTPEGVPADIVEKERAFALEEALSSGKPKEIAEKIVEGKLRKLFEGLALLRQPFVKDDSKTIQDLLPPGAQIVAFYRWQVGETG
ncbi:MAG: translation elongation factor Ts [Planctomycetota bacterium]|nr:MAG: translation elongation factor Ts [Planctomycetota bacterium]